MTYKKKLIEVALPLEAINIASAREKSIRHGHPSTLHLWWARRPLAAARAVIFAQMVDDPSAHPDIFKTEKAQEKERQRLFRIIEELVKWENTTNEAVLQQASDEIWQSWRYTCAATRQDLANRTQDIDEAEQARILALYDPEKLPGFHDPFAGGGALPLEAQRLGLESYASDLNPVAVLINKAMIEIPPKFAGKPPVHPDHTVTSGYAALSYPLGQTRPTSDDAAQSDGAQPDGAQPVGRVSGASRVTRQTTAAMFEREWKGAQGLAEDVRYYGQWMRDEAEKRIGHLYPKVKIPPRSPLLQRGEVTAATLGEKGEVIGSPLGKRGAGGDFFAERPDLIPYAGKELTVIAWLWARTVKSPNPAFANVDVPLASTFMLSTKAGKEAYVEPVIEDGSYHFTVKVGKPKDAEAAKSGTSAGKRAGFKCVMSGTPLPYDYIRSEGQAGRMGSRLMAIVAEGERGRVYLAPTAEMEDVARQAKPEWKPDTPMHGKCRVNVSNYGLDVYGDLFTSRQLVALTTFADLVQEARDRIKRDAIKVGLPDPSTGSGQAGKPLADGGTGATAYADAVGVYLAFAISKLADRGSTICTWFTERDSTRNTFARQSIPMTWDYAELNTLLDGTGSFLGAVQWTAESIEGVAAGYGSTFGASAQVDATNQTVSAGKLVSTDPPYYDNIGYADLSDFFYVWLRRSLKPVFPDLFATLAVPKAEELIATPYRHGGKQKAETFFLDGMTQAMHRLAEQAHPAFPVTIYYAFKQAESDGGEGTTNTGWDTFLAAVIEAGFAISGTWPMRTELSNRMIGSGTNALASSIVLVCRQRPANAPTATRREFVAALKAELPQALAHLQAGNIAPVDLAQAAIGPGMAVYTRYAKVLDAEGQPLSVRAALALINQTLDEALAEQEGDFDADTRWALTWFEQTGFLDGDYGVAEQLSKSKNTSVSGLVEAGILVSKAGKVRLLRPAELPADWDPTTDKRLTVWEMVHHLIRVLESGGEGAAAQIVAKLGSGAETARELCYRLYTLCERKKRANEAMAYNGLVQSWPEITLLARESVKVTPAQAELL